MYEMMWAWFEVRAVGMKWLEEKYRNNWQELVVECKITRRFQRTWMLGDVVLFMVVVTPGKKTHLQFEVVEHLM